MGHPLIRRGLSAVTDAISPFITDARRDRIADLLAKGLRDRVTTYREVAAREDVRTWWFDREREYEFDLPAYYDELPPEIERLVGTHTCQSPFVMEVPEVMVHTESGLLADDNGRYLIFNFWNEKPKEYAARGLAYDFMMGLGSGEMPDLDPRNEGDVETVPVAASLLSKHATNYTHWVQDCLALLEGIEEYADRTGTDPLLIVPPDPPAFITESLDVMGYVAKDYRKMDCDRLRAERLVLPSTRRCLSSTSEDYFRMISGIEWVRDRAVERVDTAGAASEYASKVLISREDADTRRFVNRGEVAATLSDYGFETYVPGSMSYYEQVRLFSQAEAIVGAHGAGMINCIYASDASVLELYGSHYLPANYELAHGLDFRYGCLSCDPMNRDMHVDIEKLAKAVRMLKMTEDG